MSKLSIKPLADRVVIKPTPESSETKSGIILGDNKDQKPMTGTIVAVGNGIIGEKEVKMAVKIGDAVLYGKFSGTEVTLDDESYLIMREADILAII